MIRAAQRQPDAGWAEASEPAINEKTGRNAGLIGDKARKKVYCTTSRVKV